MSCFLPMTDDAASSESSAQLRLEGCALCTTLARYKCPRCATPTCSLTCSRKHKQDTRCSGERDKTQYVPMNAYSWGAMMRDYCYLEDIGRKVSEWGDEIVRGGYTTKPNAGKAASTQKPSSGRKSTAGKSKRDILRAHLEALGIDVELLPAGMERRNLNQSTFDQKSQYCLLTIEFVFHLPTTTASISSTLPPSYKILSHRNNLETTLLFALQRQVSSTLSKSQKHKEVIPDWLPPIVNPHPEAPECFAPPHCYISANTEFPHAPNVVYYHKLEPTLSLSELLQKTCFIEFPTIHVFDPDASSFNGTIIDKSGLVVLGDDQPNDSRGLKRRKLNKTVGLKAVYSLVGEYGSEASSHSEEEISNKQQDGLATLEVYSGSEDEGIPGDTEGEDHSNSDEDVPAEDRQLDPARLLEIVRQAQNAADDDILDWGDEWDIDQEQ